MATNMAVELDDALLSLGEPIETIILGPFGPAGRHIEGEQAPVGRPISWAAARPWLDKEVAGDFAVYRCRPFFAYTKSWILFVVGNQDRGWVSVERIPRHPSPTGGIHTFS